MEIWFIEYKFSLLNIKLSLLNIATNQQPYRGRASIKVFWVPPAVHYWHNGHAGCSSDLEIFRFGWSAEGIEEA